MPGFGEPMLHVDMDAFFVEVERLRRPELRGIPVAVGGAGGRGVVASASYEARRHGVRSAMPSGRARRLCPQLVFVAPDHGEYSRLSDRVFDVLRSFTPLVEALSIDEAFLDVRGLRRHYRAPADIAAAIRRRLRGDVGLPASVGAASNKFLAKLASEAAKPDGTLVVPAGGELAFLHPLPVRALWGVGDATQRAVAELGVTTVGELAALPRALLERRLGGAAGSHLHELAWARDPRPVETGGDARSISVEETYEADLLDPDRVDAELFAHCERLARRLRHAGVAARTIHLKVRYDDFSTISRSMTLDGPVDLTGQLADAARALLRRTPPGRPIRLLGVGGSQLADRAEPRQLDLGSDDRRALAAAADRIRDRFGNDAVAPARLIPRPEVEGSPRAAPESAGNDAGPRSIRERRKGYTEPATGRSG